MRIYVVIYGVKNLHGRHIEAGILVEGIHHFGRCAEFHMCVGVMEAGMQQIGQIIML